MAVASFGSALPDSDYTVVAVTVAAFTVAADTLAVISPALT